MQHGKAIYEILNVQGEINIKLAKEISASEPPYILDGGEYGLLIKYSTTKKTVLVLVNQKFQNWRSSEKL